MIRDKLKQDSMVALKNHDNARVDVLRFLRSLIDKKELQLPPGSLNEAEEISILRKELKNKEESRNMFSKAGREDLVKQMDYEIIVVKEYLPEEITEEKITQIVDEVIDVETRRGASVLNFGMIMKETMNRLNGGAGGDVVSRIVKERISKL